MAVVPKPNASAIFDLKSAALTVVALVLKTPSLALLAEELRRRFADAPDLFDEDPVAIDLTALRDDETPIDFATLVALLRGYRMVPVAVRGGSAAQMQAARAAGLGEAPEGMASAARPQAPPVLQEVITEVVREVPAPATLLIERPLRSGQQIYAKNADLVVLAVVSYGAEVIADGNIHVYAPLRGRAVAGARGDRTARIFSTCMQPQLLSIAGYYRTTETALPAGVLAKPAQARLDGERLVVEALKL